MDAHDVATNATHGQLFYSVKQTIHRKLLLMQVWSEEFPIIMILFRILCLCMPFELIAIWIRTLARSVVANFDFYGAYTYIFDVYWMVTYLMITFSFGRYLGMVVYGIGLIIAFIFFFTNCVHLRFTRIFFSFNSLKFAREGLPYIMYSIMHMNTGTYIYCLLIFFSGIVALIQFPRAPLISESSFVIFVVCILIHTPLTSPLVERHIDQTWSEFKQPRRLYKRWSDPNKLMKLCGLYEFIVRDFYMTFIKRDTAITDDDRQFISKCYEHTTAHIRNRYTGLWKGRNLILLQLEGLDSWLLNEKDTPNLYHLKQTGISFSNHFSFAFGGGATFHSEFCVNTGFMAPITFVRNADTFSTNSFPFSLARQFKHINYTVNSFHMNTEEFYSRGVNYRNWGYDDYYGLLARKTYKKGDQSYTLDTTLISRQGFYHEIFESKQPFLDYIITYSIHHPYSLQDSMGKLILQKPNHSCVNCTSEESIIRLFAGETDEMVGDLIGTLRKLNLYNSTVIVAFADHYSYGLGNTSLFQEYMGKDPAMWNRTPFFLWASDIAQETITTPNVQQDIGPTILNLFGIPFIEEYYMGRDILSPSHPAVSIFRDGSTYDGKKHTMTVTEQTKNYIRKNDLTLRMDYFRHIR